MVKTSVHILDGQKVLIFKGQEWSGDRKSRKKSENKPRFQGKILKSMPKIEF